MRIEFTPTGKLVALVLLALAIVGVILVQGPDGKRYLKMESM
jgi:preprotein translocase subunit SecG